MAIHDSQDIRTLFKGSETCCQELTMERQQALLKDETTTQHYALELTRKDGIRRKWSRD